MIDKEDAWDKRLQIKTTGRDASNSDQYRYPYEPTPYGVPSESSVQSLSRVRLFATP